MILTENFSLKEFMRLGSINQLPAKQKALVSADVEEPDEDVLANIKILANSLQKVRDFVNLPIIIRSGYRPPLYDVFIARKYGFERDISKPGAHSTGRAADIDVSGATKIQCDYDLTQAVLAALKIDCSKLSNRAKLGWLFYILNRYRAPRVIFEAGSLRAPVVCHVEVNSLSQVVWAERKGSSWAYKVIIDGFSFT